MMTDTEAIPETQTSHEQRRAVRIMAKALFQQFQRHGYSESHVIDFTSEILELLTDSIRAPVSTPTSSTELVPASEANP